MTKCTDAAEDFMTALPHDNDLNQGLFETPCARNNLKFLVQKLLQSFITLAYHNWANDFFFIGNQSFRLLYMTTHNKPLLSTQCYFISLLSKPTLLRDAIFFNFIIYVTLLLSKLKKRNWHSKIVHIAADGQL